MPRRLKLVLMLLYIIMTPDVQNVLFNVDLAVCQHAHHEQLTAHYTCGKLATG